MHILFLDVASHDGLLACSTEERVAAHRAIDHRIGDHELVPLIEDTLREAGWSHEDLTHLACVIGPGGFTSLRVGVSCMNALSWALKIPVVGVHLSDLYAARVQRKHDSQNPRSQVLDPESFLWLHSTKRTELFLRGFGSFAQEWSQPMHITLDNFLSHVRGPRLQPRVSYVGELLPEHQKRMEDAGAAPLPLCPVMDVLPRFLSSLTYTQQVLQPWYGRGW